MRRNILILIISGILLSSLSFGYSGGDGSAGSPYQIANVTDFQQLSVTPADWWKSFILTANISLTGLTLTQAPIAPDTYHGGLPPDVAFQGTGFTGIFDGNGHTISNLTITLSDPPGDYVGLFGYVNYPGVVKNLDVENVNITGRYWVGGLVGYNDRGTLTSCYATGSVSAIIVITLRGAEIVGGLVGMNDSGVLTGCYTTVSVSGGYSGGGLVGHNIGTLTSCYAAGTVSNGIYSVGGLVGINGGLLTLCYATASVNGSGHSGGLVGRSTGTLSDCYATGNVTGMEYVGGLVGYLDTSTLSDCYATNSVSGDKYIGGLVGRNIAGMLISCYTAGSASGNNYVGGLVGNNSGSLTSCYAISSVTGINNYVGGLVGMNDSGALTGCYAAGNVIGSEDVGGLAGKNDLGTITGCFWDVQTSGQTTSVGGIGLPTAAMYNAETYLHYFWDFKGEIANGTLDVWAMPAEVGYPVLAWQIEGSSVGNDEIDGAIAVATDSTISSSSIGATGVDITRNGYNDSADVWYYFDCTETDKYTFTVQPTGFNSTLGMFDAAQREVVFNDDFFGEKSVVILNATAGRRYYIRVAGYDGQTGNFKLTLAQGAIQAIQGDLNYDGMVNLVDFAILAEHWLVGV